MGDSLSHHELKALMDDWRSGDLKQLAKSIIEKTVEVKRKSDDYSVAVGRVKPLTRKRAASTAGSRNVRQRW